MTEPGISSPGLQTPAYDDGRVQFGTFEHSAED